MFLVLHVRIAALFIPFRTVRCASSLRLLSQISMVLWLHRTFWRILKRLTTHASLDFVYPVGYVRASVTHLRESLFTSTSTSPCSQTGDCLTNLVFIGQHVIVCYPKNNIDQFSLNNYFSAQSLHLRYSSVAPCPTLRAYVTSSPPKTRHGRTATPYPTGLPCCDVISLQRPISQFSPNLIIA